MTERITKLDYCQYLLSSQINYTLTNFADHIEKFSHDQINRYLRQEKITPSQLWEAIEERIIFSPRGFLIFDDTVLNKCYSREIEGVRRQWSGNEHRIIQGIGVVNCLYYNPDINEFWVVNYRIFDPEKDGKTKIDHIQDMLESLVFLRKIPFSVVLMDTWYACREVMMLIEKLGKIYYCPLKVNRLVDDSNALLPYKPVSELNWTKKEREEGKIIKINKFPKYHKVKLFRVPVSPNRTDFVVTNDKTQSSLQDTQKVCGLRWKIEEFHRELKQTTGIEKCECRIRRIQRNHIGCAMLVWSCLKELAYQTGKTIYHLKDGLLDDYLIQQLKHPTIKFA